MKANNPDKEGGDIGEVKTPNLDQDLATADFTDRLYLVKISNAKPTDVEPGNEVATYNLWPALTYNYFSDLVGQLTNNELKNIIHSEHHKLLHLNPSKKKYDTNKYGIAYLLRREKTHPPLVLVPKNSNGIVAHDNHNVFDFFAHVDEMELGVGHGEGYCGSEQFQAAYKFAINRIEKHVSDDIPPSPPGVKLQSVLHQPSTNGNEKSSGLFSKFGALLGFRRRFDSTVDTTETSVAKITPPRGDAHVSNNSTDLPGHDNHEDYGHSDESAGSYTSSDDEQVEMRQVFEPSRSHQGPPPSGLPSTSSSKDSGLNGKLSASSQTEKKKKNQRGKKSKNNRTNAKRATNNEVGSRIIRTPSLSVSVDVPNQRRCLLDSLLSLITDVTIQNSIKQEFLRTMASSGDTPICVGIKALSGQSMTLKHVTDQYTMPLELSLLQNKAPCRLILVVRLFSKKVGPNGETFADHCVAWDGSIIHDQPKSVMVNNSSDRANELNSRAVFNRIFHPNDYAKWQIIQVFKLSSTNQNHSVSGRKRRRNQNTRGRNRKKNKKKEHGLSLHNAQWT